MKIRLALTTFDTAINILIERGLKVYCEDLEECPEIDNKNDYYYKYWISVKDNFVVTAINPIELLRLAMICERYAENWLKKEYKSNYKYYFNK